tara:strand:+ start:1788 stop:2027 length:240 start_codon:yes stop_codon:yes gene_type:complete
VHQSILGSLGLLAFVVVNVVPATAGTITASSIWNSSNAMQRARSRVPAGATITKSHCVTVQVRLDFHYRCTVNFTTKAP